MPAQFYGVEFDEVAWGEDLRAASVAGREVAVAARADFGRSGVAAADLRRCRADAVPPLPGCLKVYLGPVEGPGRPGKFGMVFAGTDDPGFLFCLAFGVRHMPAVAFKPNVYQRAYRRLSND